MADVHSLAPTLQQAAGIHWPLNVLDPRTMPHARSDRPRFTESDVPLIVLARQLHLPVKTVLHLSSEGHIPLFVRARHRDAIFVSIHEDLIAPRSGGLPTVLATLAGSSTMGVTDLGAEGMTGFFLSPDDCRELMHTGKVKQGLFPAAVKKHLNYLNAALPNPGFFPIDRVPGLAPDGWRVACYPKETLFDLTAGSGYPPPIDLDITPIDLYARRDDIDIFIDVIDMIGATGAKPFLHDLLVGEHVIDEKPAYISQKLTHLIETSERFWRIKPVDTKDYDTKREKVRRAMQDPEFHSYFDKSSPAEGVLDAAERFIEPMYARKIEDDEKQAWPWYLTPEIVTLVAASKLYWSPPHVDLEKVATHPRNEEIEAYLRIRGISGNRANSAMTLIRPEEAARGRPVSDAYSRPRFSRNHIRS